MMPRGEGNDQEIVPEGKKQERGVEDPHYERPKISQVKDEAEKVVEKTVHLI
jgi:hypothetical protein